MISAVIAGLARCFASAAFAESAEPVAAPQCWSTFALEDETKRSFFSNSALGMQSNSSLIHVCSSVTH